MPADLTVVDVKPPHPLRAPCPIVILVEIKNIGNDPADPVPYDVTIDLLGAGDIPAAKLGEAIVTHPEDQRLTPGRTIFVPVQVRLPCISPITLRATVDKQQQIPNKLRPPSAPYMELTGLIPSSVPWLVATLQVGIRDTTGMVTFDPKAFCPGKAVVAEVLITNEGCITSKPSKTEVTLEDANAVPLPVRLTTHSYIVPALAPGKSHSTSLSFAAPSSTAGFSGALGVRVSAPTST